MKVTIWGAQGSIPTPLSPKEVEEKIFQALFQMPVIDTHDPESVLRYIHQLPFWVRSTVGGNTSCLSIEAGDTLVIIDAGSGIRELGRKLMEGPAGQGEGVIHIIFSHAHWDHIQGFPFFTPAYIPGNQIYIYGVHDMETILSKQQRPVNFPVPLSALQAKITFNTIQPAAPFNIGPLQINTIRNNHPGDSYSFRLDDKISSFVYASDVEYKELDGDGVQDHIDFFREADALLFDAQYAFHEYLDSKIDWGHSAGVIGLDLARRAGVKKLVLSHHEPTYPDKALVELLETTTEYQEQDKSLPTCEVILAYEGLALDLEAP